MSWTNKGLKDRLEKLEERAGLNDQQDLILIVTEMLDGSLFLTGDPSIIFKDKKSFKRWCDKQEEQGIKKALVIYDLPPFECNQHVKEEMLTNASVFSRGRVRPMNETEKEYRINQLKIARTNH